MPTPKDQIGRVEQTRAQHICRNCGLPIEPLLDPWGGQHGWHHSTLTDEFNLDGMDVEGPQTFCPDDQGEAEPMEEGE